MSREIGLSGLLRPGVKDNSKPGIGEEKGTPEISSSWPSWGIISSLEIRVNLSAEKQEKKKITGKKWLLSAAFALAGVKRKTSGWPCSSLLFLSHAPKPQKAQCRGKKPLADVRSCPSSHLSELAAVTGGWARAASQYSAPFSPESSQKTRDERERGAASEKVGCRISTCPQNSLESRKRRSLCRGMVCSSSKARNDSVWLRRLITRLEE